MSLTVNLYLFKKRINSTALPGEDVLSISYDGVLLDGADILHPKVAFRFDSQTNVPFTFTYANISLFSNRYYYIDNWVFDGGLWVASMSVDVLASYRENIKESEQYILRSARKSSVEISDMLYPPVSGVDISKLNIELIGDGLYNITDLKSGTFVVGVVNRDTESFGTVSYYAFSSGDLLALSAVLMGDFSWLNISPDEMSEELSKALINPLQYIVSCMWYPIPPTKVKRVNGLSYGWWTLDDVSCHTMEVVNKDWYIGRYTIPAHTQGNNFSYLNASPYTTCFVVIEPWGSLEIPTSYYNSEHRIYCTTDYITGKSILEIKTTSGEVLARKEAQLGVPVQLSQVYVDVMKTVSSAVQTISGVAGSVLIGNVGGAVSNTMSGIASTIESAKPILSNSGTDGSYLAFATTPYIVIHRRNIVEPDNERFGSPYSKKDFIRNHEGFVLCANPTLELPHATPYEIETATNYLSAGLYYE